MPIDSNAADGKINFLTAPSFTSEENSTHKQEEPGL